MTRFAVRLPRHQARIVALAVAYHLARPGSEIDPSTMAEYAQGLREVLPAIERQLDADHAALELSPLQTVLLSNALSSIISELKMHSIFDVVSGASGRPRSTAPGFDDALRALFPQIAGDSSYASQLSEDAMMLRRQLPSARAKEALEEEREAAEALARSRRKPWQFWKR